MHFSFGTPRSADHIRVSRGPVSQQRQSTMFSPKTPASNMFSGQHASPPATPNTDDVKTTNYLTISGPTATRLQEFKVGQTLIDSGFDDILRATVDSIAKSASKHPQMLDMIKSVSTSGPAGPDAERQTGDPVPLPTASTKQAEDVALAIANGMGHSISSSILELFKKKCDADTAITDID